MTTYIAGNAFYFNDGSSLASAYLPWSQVSGKPSYLSQFSNNVGYLTGVGGWPGNCQQSFGNCGNVGYGNVFVNTYRQGNNIVAQPTYQNCYNCNCNCNCNC